MSKSVYLFILSTLLTCNSNIQAQTVSGTIRMEFDLSAHRLDKEAQLWIPYPITDKNQSITNIRITGDFASCGVYTDRMYQTHILYARWDADAKTRKLIFLFDVARQEDNRKDFPNKESAWDPMDYTLYLAPTQLGPVDGDIKTLADTITKGKKTVLEKARAIYDWTCENTHRNPDILGCGAGDVCKFLKDPGGKCVDISSLFVALSRAAGVPSRDVFGIRLGKTPQDDITQKQHCWAEFYLPGYGWVPVDPADVRKMMLEQRLEISDPKIVEKRDYFFGSLDPYRMKLSDGRDLKLNPPQNGNAVNYLMYPFAQIGDETIDSLNPADFKYTISYNNK